MVSFHPQSPISMATVQGNLGRVVRSKTERKGNLKTCYSLIWFIGKKSFKSYLNSEQNYFFYLFFLTEALLFNAGDRDTSHTDKEIQWLAGN